jgi:hypothetical protein
MAIVVTVREYNPTTGNLIGNTNSLKFGNINVGEVSPVRVVDMTVSGASFMSNVRLAITSADLVPVNDSPIDIGSDNSAGNGNFGVESSTTFLSRNTLSRFFPGVNGEVTIGTRSASVSKYTYLNVRMDTSSTGSGKVVYKWFFDVS